MLKTVSSPSVNAKIKGMYAKKLKKSDLEDLMKQRTIKDAIILLKAKIPELNTLNIDADRLELEDELDNILISDFIKLEKYLRGVNKKILNAYILKYKIDILKREYDIVNDNTKVLNRRIHQKMSKEIMRWTDTVFKELKNIEDITSKKELIDRIINTEIKRIVIESDNLQNRFFMENKLDKFYFSNLLKSVKGVNPILEKEVKMNIDLLNIIWIYRYVSNGYDLDTSILLEDGYRITQNKIEKLKYIKTIDDIKEILKDTIYSGIIKSDIEKDFMRFLYEKYMKSFKNEIFDISIVINYLNILEIEKRNIITIIEGIRYKLSMKEIQEKIII